MAAQAPSLPTHSIHRVNHWVPSSGNLSHLHGGPGGRRCLNFDERWEGELAGNSGAFSAVCRLEKSGLSSSRRVTG